MNILTKSPLPGALRNAPGKLNLLISGFSVQHIVAVSQVVQAVDVLPIFHLEGLREILYMPDSSGAYSAVFSGLGKVSRKGEFKQRERRIVILGFDDLDMFLQVLYHEIGHFVFFLAIGSRVKKRWVTEIFPNSECITHYASLNASEDFAETYAAYVRNSENLRKKLPVKFAFMRDCVFSGRPETLKEKG